MIRFPGEHSCVGRLSLAMRRFSKVIEDLELSDISLQRGPLYLEWSDKLNNQSEYGLDCFLVFEAWYNLFSGALQRVLTELVPIHSSILLDREGLRKGLMRMKF